MKIKSILTSILIMFIAGTVVYAAYSKTLPNTVTIIQESGGPEPNIQLGFYSDSQTASPLSSLTWGEMEKGSSSNKTFYIKNESDVQVTISPSSNLSNQIGTVSVAVDNATLAVNQTTKADVTLSLKNNAPLGAVNFNITITAN